jgi:hypothetical protein
MRFFRAKQAGSTAQGISPGTWKSRNRALTRIAERVRAGSPEAIEKFRRVHPVFMTEVLHKYAKELRKPE